MSALTEKVAREHRAVGIIGACTCGDHPKVFDSADHHRTWHLIEVTEAAARAQVAADIRAQRFIDAAPDWNRSSDEAAFDDALTFAAEIAEEVGM